MWVWLRVRIVWYATLGTNRVWSTKMPSLRRCRCDRWPHAMAWCLPTQGLVCVSQPDFHVLWFEVPEYPRAKLRQPELFGICMLVRKHAFEPVCKVPGPVCEEPGHRV